MKNFYHVNKDIKFLYSWVIEEKSIFGLLLKKISWVYYKIKTMIPNS